MSSSAESGSRGGGRGGRGGRGGSRGGGRGGRGGDNAPEQRSPTENVSETSTNSNGSVDQGGNRGGKGGAKTGGRTYDDSAFNKLVDKENATLADIAKKQEEARKKTDALSSQISEKSKLIEKLKTEKETALATLKTTTAEKKKLKEEKKLIADKVQLMKAEIHRKKDELKNAKAKLLIKRVDEKFEGNHLQELIRLNQEEFTKRIGDIEKRLKTTKMTLYEEKKLVAEQDQLTQLKKSTLKEFEQKVQEASVADNPEFKKYSEELKVRDEKVKQLIELEKGQTTTWQAVQAQFNQLRDELTKLKTERKDIYESLDKFSNQYKATKAEISNKKKKWIEEQQEQRKKLSEERDRLRKERDEERKRRQEEREAALAAMMPYETELNICDYVIEYLEGSLPKKQDSGAKKNVRQKKQTEVLRHPYDIIKSFEELSLKTPLIQIEVESSLQEVKDKKTRFLQLQEEEVKKRAAAKAAAEKAKEEQAASSEAAPAPEVATETPAVQEESKTEEKTEAAAEEAPAAPVTEEENQS